MKYLKKFESNDDYSEYGITPEELKYYFIDLVDEGWLVKLRFRKKHIQKHIYHGQFEFVLVPSIEVEIFKEWSSRNEYQDVLRELMASNSFKEEVDVLKPRLNDIGLYVKDISIENRRLRILIYRKSDSKLIK